MSQESQNDASPPDPDPPGLNSEESAVRRNFLVELLAVVVGGVISLFGVVIGLVVFLDPVTRRRKLPRLYEQGGGKQDGMIRVASLQSVPDDGVPRRFPVITDLQDAWTFSPDQPVGAVWVRRKKGSSEVQVLHATCPHAGCAVSFRTDADPQKSVFYCPCHNSAFGLDGERVDLPGKDNPSPRPMDPLEHQVDEGGNILVRFVNFYTGIHEQKPKL